MAETGSSRPPRCLNCVHFRPTWDPDFPRSCTVFGIKSRHLPSDEVFLSTGRHCPAFRARPGR
ncbi:MAG: hypothetical protein LBQ35_02155 [Spirochaetaceae bacterium]|nr:hypothetical protein [Spirochaetaceae bacterium]